MQNLDPCLQVGSIEEDLHSGSDVLAHLPEYQHRAVISVLDEMKWMLRDEIAFALTKTLPSSRHTLEFVRNHVQSSVGKCGSAVETVDLNFVFGTQVSLDKFRENFLEMEVAGFILREEGDFCYLDTEAEADTDPRTREENLSGSRRRLQRQARAHQLSPVKEALAPGPALDTGDSQTSLDSTIGSAQESEGSSIDFVDIFDEEAERSSERCSVISNLSCIFQVDRERVNMFIHFRDTNPLVRSVWRTVHQELLAGIRNICVQVNQSLLLNDLYDRRLCNRLLEQENTEDIFRDPSRLGHEGEEDGESPYLEANLNMKFSPGQFKCPEVWETRLDLNF